MKNALILMLVLSLLACANQKNTGSTNEKLNQEIIVFTDAAEEMTFRVAPNGKFNSQAEGSNHSYLLGKLVSPSHLEIGGKRMMMTTISMQMSVAPESGFLKIPERHIGKYAIVSGFSGGDLYEAGIVCVFEKEPSSELLHAFEEGKKDLSTYCR